MKYLYLLTIIYLTTSSVWSSPVTITQMQQQKLLVFSKTAGYHHQSIAAGNAAIQKLGRENKFDVDLTTNSSLFTDNNLKQYAAVVWLSTTNDVLNSKQRMAFTKYIQAGHGFVGIHSAMDTEYYWPWYNQLLGGYLSSHPARLQNATLNVVDRTHISTKHLPAKWQLNDEWYNYGKTYWNDVHILITIDETSYIGGENGNIHPMSWYREFDGGRSFYTEISHTDVTYQDSMYLQHLLGGIQYAMGIDSN
ncbi:unnamed protein product [Adineta steineri]|uniref:ThuA-like domain-containing protein n=1 Tax=Adineta steineri TaxID=433720 RepID=A0A815UGH6_9BILA|nr:unnamed protein product [Adineta steineri]